MACCLPLPLGACCTGGICAYLLSEDCAATGGTFQGAGTVCEPNPCEIYAPAEGTSWGRIKSLYR